MKQKPTNLRYKEDKVIDKLKKEVRLEKDRKKRKHRHHSKKHKDNTENIGMDGEKEDSQKDNVSF
eukprot:NODE_169_length_2304_cov_121.236807_g145_i0.p6 GENE.NODE_169_length_2304_cov_121.236807_g145_i0~~NODE_169_length_2304_cov_121.236807_g145_i0.p6  ORF type:complete len:65 (-),score=2.39 NODE_169_length_2304_cov_121.236807_g145_i0:38-232(-)